MAKSATLILCVGFVCAGIFHLSEGAISGDFSLQLSITNQNYEDSLLDPQSDYYKSLESEVMDLVNGIYGCSDCLTKSFYTRASDVAFSQDGSSVNVKLELSFSINIDTTVVQDIFNSQYPHIQTQLQVDTADTQVLTMDV